MDTQTGGTTLRRGRWFGLTWLAAISVMVLPAIFSTEPVRFAPTALFALVVTAASLCVLTSLWLMTVAHRRNLAELGFVATWFLILSMLPLVHGITTPGILYNSNQTFTASIFIAGPAAALAALPTLFRRTRWANWIAQRWRYWAASWGLAAVTLGAVMLAKPNAISNPAMGTRIAILLAIPSVAFAMAYGWRHLTMAAISGSRRYLPVFFGFVLSGAANLVWVTAVPYGPTFWAAHFFDISGVFAGTIGGAVVYLRGRTPSDLMAEVLQSDPLIAIDLALDPAVGQFIEDLDAKDPVTRDHVLRTAEATTKVAGALGLGPVETRNTAIAAVLHDIGKLGIPDAILNKPDRLTDDEYEIVKQHPVIGSELLRINPSFASVSQIVRAHHERMDGTGYPDGLRAEQIPMAARIVSVCDAYDAMAHDRPYRAGIGKDKALAVLREHSGSQWDPNVVEAFVPLVENDLIRTAPTTLDHLGRDDQRTFDHEDVGCGCLAALPDEVAEDLVRATSGS